MKIIALFLSFATFLPLIHAMDVSTAHTHLQEGNKFFGEKNLLLAVQHYKQALQYAPSAEVYFNLGSAYASLQRPEHALLYFLKAKQYRPRWETLKQSIHTLYQIYPSLPRQKLNLSQKILQFATLNTWTALGSLSLWGAVLSFICYLCFIRKPLCLHASIINSLLFLFVVVLFYNNQTAFHTAIAVEDTAIRFAPTDSSPIRQEITAGNFCEMSTQQGSFTYIKTELTEGWVASDKIKPLYGED